MELTAYELLSSVTVPSELTDPDEYNSRTCSASHPSSGGCSGSAMARSGRTDAAGDRRSPNAGPVSIGSECQPGGRSIGRQTRVLRRWLRMVRLEICPSKLFVCLPCAVGMTLGTSREMGQLGAQRNSFSSRGLVFHAASLLAGHAVQREGPHASGERWRPGGLGRLESSGLAPPTDLFDAQRGCVAKAPELQLRRRGRGTTCPVRP